MIKAPVFRGLALPGSGPGYPLSALRACVVTTRAAQPSRLRIRANPCNLPASSQ